MIPRKDGAVLLARKARGFGKGKWVGFGGKVERDETVEQANVREIAEETGVRMQSARKMGLVMFTFDVEPELFLEVHVFDTDAEFDGVKLNDEYDGDAVWYPFDKIPFEVGEHLFRFTHTAPWLRMLTFLHFFGGRR